MPINFPHKPEVQLARPPLEEVVCQVRFPPILRISREEPIDLQERIRRRFPLLRLEQGVQVQFPVPGNPNAPSAEFKPKLYRFVSQDEQTAVSLTVNFYAVSTHRYTHWQAFAADLQLVHDAVQQVYQPAYATRIGLRYVNRLTLENTQTRHKDELFDLLRTELTAMLRGPVWQDATEMACQLSFVEESAQLNFSVAYEETEDPAFILDFDYFEKGKLPLDGLVERCDRYHTLIYDAFRYCLPDKTLQKFQPVQIEGET
ncbi:MAG: TIGR04255 family protein [Anaerolineae bacterium]